MPFGALYAQVLDKCAETQGLGDGATHSADTLAWQRVVSRHPAGPEPRGCFPLGHPLLQMLRLLPAAVCGGRGHRPAPLPGRPGQEGLRLKKAFHTQLAGHTQSGGGSDQR